MKRGVNVNSKTPLSIFKLYITLREQSTLLNNALLFSRTAPFQNLLDLRYWHS